MLDGGRFDVISLGFVLALWSGSRALNVFVDTITIMHGLGGHRGIMKTRALSFVLYVLAMLTGVVSIPLVVAGPRWSRDWLPERFELRDGVLLADRGRASASASSPRSTTCRCRCGPTGASTCPARRSRWWPGSLGSYVLRWVLTVTAADSRSIYGPLAAPIAVLLWLYLVAIAVLIGAAVNAAFDTVFPQKHDHPGALRAVQRLRQRDRRQGPRA